MLNRLSLFVLGVMCLVSALALAAGPQDVPKTPPKGWWPDPCRAFAAPKEGVGAKQANVVVVIYNPTVDPTSGERLTDLFRWNDPRKLNDQVIESIRKASGGYLNYHAAKVVEIDGCPPFVSGFRYEAPGIVDAVRKSKWIEGDRSSYAKIFEEAGVTRKFVEDFNITEVWLWGSPGFHWDEYAMQIPDRDKRLPPTDNPWFYRPYDIPDLGRTLWVMGWNYERGLDCALESYAHRCEGILALTQGNGKWDRALVGNDPWNTFSMCDEKGDTGIGCGSVHCPPNGQDGYDYSNTRTVTSYCEDWTQWPKPTGSLVKIDGTQWHRDHAEYLTWWMAHFPKTPGRTAWGWNNWWIYVANFDGNLADNPPK